MDTLLKGKRQVLNRDHAIIEPPAQAEVDYPSLPANRPAHA